MKNHLLKSFTTLIIISLFIFQHSGYAQYASAKQRYRTNASFLQSPLDGSRIEQSLTGAVQARGRTIVHLSPAVVHQLLVRLDAKTEVPGAVGAWKNVSRLTDPTKKPLGPAGSHALVGALEGLIEAFLNIVYYAIVIPALYYFYGFLPHQLVLEETAIMVVLGILAVAIDRFLIYRISFWAHKKGGVLKEDGSISRDVGDIFKAISIYRTQNSLIPQVVAPLLAYGLLDFGILPSFTQITSGGSLVIWSVIFHLILNPLYLARDNYRIVKAFQYYAAKVKAETKRIESAELDISLSEFVQANLGPREKVHFVIETQPLEGKQAAAFRQMIGEETNMIHLLKPNDAEARKQLYESLGEARIFTIEIHPDGFKIVEAAASDRSHYVGGAVGIPVEMRYGLNAFHARRQLELLLDEIGPRGLSELLLKAS